VAALHRTKQKKIPLARKKTGDIFIGPKGKSNKPQKGIEMKNKTL
jgi:hypothetical protein